MKKIVATLMALALPATFANAQTSTEGRSQTLWSFVVVLAGVAYLAYKYRTGVRCSQCRRVRAGEQTGVVRNDGLSTEYIEYRCKYCGHRFSIEKGGHW